MLNRCRVQATSQNKELALNWINEIECCGGTEIKAPVCHTDQYTRIEFNEWLHAFSEFNESRGSLLCFQLMEVLSTLRHDQISNPRSVLMNEL